MSNGLSKALEWHKQAKPSPTVKIKSIAIGVHIEEFAEMLEGLGWKLHAKKMHDLADGYKQCALAHMDSIDNIDRVEILDAIVDQTVTACGVSHALGFDHIGALAEVNRSNFSKFEDGKPVFDSNGKITKGKNYTPPKLDDFI